MEHNLWHNRYSNRYSYKGEFVTITSWRKRNKYNFFRPFSNILGPKWYFRSQSEGLITLRKEINNRYLNRTFSLSLTRSIDWCMIWLYIMKFYLGCFLTHATLTLKNQLFFSIHIQSNHSPIDRSRQTEWECAVKVILLTHFGMIWV